MGYVLKCKECGKKFDVNDDHNLERWEYDYCRYTCFHKHMKPKIEKLAETHSMTPDQLREFYLDCDELFISEWFPINRYNPDEPGASTPDILIRKRNWRGAKK